MRLKIFYVLFVTAFHQYLHSINICAGLPFFITIEKLNDVGQELVAGSVNSIKPPDLARQRFRLIESNIPICIRNCMCLGKFNNVVLYNLSLRANFHKRFDIGRNKDIVVKKLKMR